MVVLIHIISSWYEWLYWEDGCWIWFNDRYMLLMLLVDIYVFMVLSSVCFMIGILFNVFVCVGRGVGATCT